MVGKLERGGDRVGQAGILVEVIGMGHTHLVGDTIVFYFCIDQGGNYFSDFGTHHVVWALKKIQVEMGYLDFLTERTD